jgi:hypothetical protein
MKFIIVMLTFIVSIASSAQKNDVNLTVDFSVLHKNKAKITLIDVDNKNDSTVITNTTGAVQTIKIRNSTYQVLVEFTPDKPEDVYYGLCWKYCGLTVSAKVSTKALLFPTSFQNKDTLLFYKTNLN